MWRISREMTNGLDALDLPAELRRRIPLDVHLYMLFRERSLIPILELEALLGASRVGIKTAIYRLIRHGFLRREWGMPMRYHVVEPLDSTVLGETA